MDILTLFTTFNPAQKELIMDLMEQLTGLAKATYGFGVQAKIELESYEGVHTRLELPDVATLFQLLIYRCFVFHGYGELREGVFTPLQEITECDNLLPIYTQLLKLLGLIDPSHDDITRQEAEFNVATNQQTQMNNVGRTMQLQNAGLGFTNNMLRINRPIEQPNYLGAAISGAQTGMSTYSWAKDAGIGAPNDD